MTIGFEKTNPRSIQRLLRSHECPFQDAASIPTGKEDISIRLGKRTAKTILISTKDGDNDESRHPGDEVDESNFKIAPGGKSYDCGDNNKQQCNAGDVHSLEEAWREIAVFCESENDLSFEAWTNNGDGGRSEKVDPSLRPTCNIFNTNSRTIAAVEEARGSKYDSRHVVACSGNSLENKFQIGSLKNEIPNTNDLPDPSVEQKLKEHKLHRLLDIIDWSHAMLRRESFPDYQVINYFHYESKNEVAVDVKGSSSGKMPNKNNRNVGKPSSDFDSTVLHQKAFQSAMPSSTFASSLSLSYSTSSSAVSGLASTRMSILSDGAEDAMSDIGFVHERIEENTMSGTREQFDANHDREETDTDACAESTEMSKRTMASPTTTATVSTSTSTVEEPAIVTPSSSIRSASSPVSNSSSTPSPTTNLPVDATCRIKMMEWSLKILEISFPFHHSNHYEWDDQSQPSYSSSTCAASRDSAQQRQIMRTFSAKALSIAYKAFSFVDRISSRKHIACFDDAGLRMTGDGHDGVFNLRTEYKLLCMACLHLASKTSGLFDTFGDDAIFCAQNEKDFYRTDEEIYEYREGYDEEQRDRNDLDFIRSPANGHHEHENRHCSQSSGAICDSSEWEEEGIFSNNYSKDFYGFTSTELPQNMESCQCSSTNESNICSFHHDFRTVSKPPERSSQESIFQTTRPTSIDPRPPLGILSMKGLASLSRGEFSELDLTAFEIETLSSLSWRLSYCCPIEWVYSLVEFGKMILNEPMNLDVDWEKVLDASIAQLEYAFDKLQYMGVAPSRLAFAAFSNSFEEQQQSRNLEKDDLKKDDLTRDNGTARDGGDIAKNNKCGTICSVEYMTTQIKQALGLRYDEEEFAILKFDMANFILEE